MKDISVIYSSMKPHAKKPFPLSIFENFKFKPRHVFVFDVLCRHLDCDSEGWIKTDSKEIIHLVREHNGLKIEAVTPIMHSLKEFGYIDLISNGNHRSIEERTWARTDYSVRINSNAWDDKEAVRAPLKDPAIRLARSHAAKLKKTLS